jgi:enoyl-CoA hydratase/carnithine racemase
MQARSTQMTGRIRVEKEGRLGFLIFDHPARHNALTLEMWRQIPNAMATLEADPDVRVIVLRGALDAAFVAGADISEFEEARNPDNRERYEQENSAAYSAIHDAQKPTVAMIHGFCIGGGLAIAVQADLRYAADDARLGIPAARLGLGYSTAGVRALTQLVGFSRAKELLFTTKRFDAREALQMGLVNATFEKAKLEQEVRSIAHAMAQNAPLTLRAIKRTVQELEKPEADRDLMAPEAQIKACFESDDYREGVRAFMEKRAPIFNGR